MRRVPIRSALAALACLVAGTAGVRGAERDMPGLAIADFDYQDSSGEAGDQAAAHAARLRAFVTGLRADLQSKKHDYLTAALPCEAQHCSAGTLTPAQLLDAAKRAGARYVLFGGIHKESTLIEWARVEMIDVSTGKLVFNQLFTFRGDSDDAWRHAEGFIADALPYLGTSK